MTFRTAIYQNDFTQTAFRSRILKLLDTASLGSLLIPQYQVLDFSPL